MSCTTSIRAWWWVGCLAACQGQGSASPALAPAAERAPSQQLTTSPGWRVTLDPDTGEPTPEAVDEALDAPGAAGAARAADVVEEVGPHGGRLVRLRERFHMHSRVELDGSTTVQRCEGER